MFFFSLSLNNEHWTHWFGLIQATIAHRYDKKSVQNIYCWSEYLNDSNLLNYRIIRLKIKLSLSIFNKSIYVIKMTYLKVSSCKYSLKCYRRIGPNRFWIFSSWLMLGSFLVLYDLFIIIIWYSNIHLFNFFFYEIKNSRPTSNNGKMCWSCKYGYRLWTACFVYVSQLAGNKNSSNEIEKFGSFFLLFIYDISLGFNVIE